MARGFYKKIFLVAVILGGLIFLNSYFFNDFFQNLVYKIVGRPGIFFTNNLLNFSKYSNGFLKTKAVVDENSGLKEENNVLRGKLAELEELRRENEFLRKELDVAGRLAAPLLLIKIFNIQKNAVSSTALINGGANNGIKKSMPVIAAGNILAGIVEQVFEDSALVLLLDDPRVKTSGRVLESRILAETRGGLLGDLSVDLVSNSEEVKEGDSIVTSGLDGLPESLLVGRIIKVETRSGALFRTVTARPFFDASLGSSLFVILK